jgi:hypothetical protein
MPRAARLERPEARREDERQPPRRPQPPAEQLLQLQRSAGNAAVARAILARQFDFAAHRKAMEEREEFMKQEFLGPAWRPSTGLGIFDVRYEPKNGRLTITVNCKFWFKHGKPADFEDEEEGDHTWQPAEILKWKADFMRKVSSRWSDKYTFHCTKPWWEDLRADVKVVFVETPVKQAHYELYVTKIPELQERKSRVRRPKKHGNRQRGSAYLDSHDNESFEGQTPSVHEAGHMLGLGDEYSHKKFKEPPAHEKLVQAEFGHGVPRRKDGRVMASGDDIQPEHGVTFLEALRGVTWIPWSYTAKPPTPGPPAPEFSEPVDGPLPKRQDPFAPEEPEVAFV